MIKFNQKILEESPLNTLATSLLAIAGGEAGAFRSSVFEINKSSSIVNFITHVWSCCSDLLFAVWAYGPEGRQLILRNQAGFYSIKREHSDKHYVFLKPKHVSVIDVDPCIEVK